MNPSSTILLIACMLASLHLTLAQNDRKECSLSSECDDSSACLIGRCVEPCLLDLCGENAACATVHHDPICKCLPNYTGDPLTGCRHECESNDECGSQGRCRNFECYPDVVPGGSIIRIDDRRVDSQHPCHPNPCSYNEFCLELKGHAFCQCRYAPFRRLPESGCNPECVDKFDCPSDETCIFSKCLKSCLGDCSPNAECFVFNYKICRPKNSRPECTSNNDCQSDKACDGYKCVNPCLDYCVDENTDCQIVNQEPICNCKPGYHRDFDGAGCYLDDLVPLGE